MNSPKICHILTVSFPAAMLLTMFILIAQGNSANITCFGDSITSGSTSPTGGYPPKLKALLNGNSKPSNVSNKGKFGEKTLSGVSRIDAALNSSADFILIMEGTNDIRGGLSVQTTEFNLQTMINKAKSKGVTPILATLTPSDRNGCSTLIPDVWNPMIQRLAGRNGIAVADQYSAIVGTWGGCNADGIHPNDRGYQTIAQTWFNVIGSAIDSTGAVNPDRLGEDSGGGLLIAIAAYGSPLAEQVKYLKNFRDQILLKFTLGKAFVKVYDKYSPPIADVISRYDTLQFITRIALYPLVGFSYLVVKLTLIQLLVVAGAAVFLLTGFRFVWAGRKVV